jgi:diguanylate cyclase (GGDEF)-like protein
MMPGMNGYETCRQIRKKFPIDDLPIIFLTAREDATSVIEGFKAGGSDFVCKNFVPEILLARVAVHIRMAQTLRTIREISLTDDLTQTYNRRHAMFTLREWFARCSRYGTHFALIYLDLNDLKCVNDRHGHQAGDLMLRSVVTAIKRVLRESDMLFRMGGDEFMVLCPDTDMDGALTCVNRMIEGVESITIVDQSASFAYGIVHSTDNYKQMDDMLHAADDAMYICKARMKK